MSKFVIAARHCTVCSCKGQQAKTYSMFEEPHAAGMLLVNELLARYKFCTPPQDSGKVPDSLLTLRSTSERLHSIGRVPLRLLPVRLTANK